MRRFRRAWIASVVVSFGCGPTLSIDGEGSTGRDTVSDSGAMTSPPPGTATTPPNPGTTTVPTDPGTTTGLDGGESSESSESSEDGGFIEDPDGGLQNECDLFEQDCPRGHKCLPYSRNGLHWNVTGCFPIVEDPAEIGEPCTVQDHPFSGLDDCGPVAICFAVDEQTLEGTCHGLCIGDETNPSCAIEGHMCLLGGDGMGLCLPNCDPIVQNCPEGEGCYPFDGGFRCSSVANPVGPGGACNAINACASGLACMEPQTVPVCPGNWCCSSFCEVGDPMPSCLFGQICRPWFEPGQAPPGQEHIGICAMPGA